MVKIDLRRASHASILLVCFVTAKSLLGLLLKRAIAGSFGAGGETDAYFAAFTVPQQLGDFVIGGIIFRVVIPVFQKRRNCVGDERASEDVSGVLNFSVFLLLLLTVSYFVVAPWIIPSLFPGFGEKTMLLTVSFARWLSPAIFLMGFSLIYTAFYHAYKDFFVPAIASLCFPISSLLALYIFPQEFGAMRLIYGNLIGISLGVLLLVVFLRKKFKWTWNWRIDNPALIATWAVAWPLLLGNLVGKVIPFVQKNAASRLDDLGSISLLEYAFFLSGSVMIFISSPVSTTIFPLMAEQCARGDREMLTGTFHQAIRIVVFLSIPLAAVLGVESELIVRVLLKNGLFSAEDVHKCGLLLCILSIVIVPQSVNMILTNMFLVYQKTRAISFWGVLLTLLSVPCYYVMAIEYAIYGIASTYVAFFILSCLLHTFLLVRWERELVCWSGFITTLRFISCGVVCVSCMLVGKIAAKGACCGYWSELILVVLFGGGSYLIACHFLKLGELMFVLQRLPLVGTYWEKSQGTREF